MKRRSGPLTDEEVELLTPEEINQITDSLPAHEREPIIAAAELAYQERTPEEWAAFYESVLAEHYSMDASTNHDHFTISLKAVLCLLAAEVALDQGAGEVVSRQFAALCVRFRALRVSH